MIIDIIVILKLYLIFFPITGDPRYRITRLNKSCIKTPVGGVRIRYPCQNTDNVRRASCVILRTPIYHR